MENRLKQKRIEAGLSQFELSQLSDVNFRMIQFYEQGVKDINKAQATTLLRLAEALNCKIEDLIDKPKTQKEYIAIGEWHDDYDGAGIYSLVDQDGKRYIGQALNMQRRLNQHRIALNKVAKNEPGRVAEGMELVDAVASGKRFHVEILKKIDKFNVTKNVLNYWEKYYFEQFGGYDGTYNSQDLYEPRWDYEPYNDVSIKIDFDENEEKDIIAYLDSYDSPSEEIKRIIREEMKKK